MRNLRLLVLIIFFSGHSGFSISDEKSDAWVKANPWFGPEKEMTEFAMKTHEKLISEGADPASNKYYSQIDDAIRKAYPSYFQSPQDYIKAESARLQILLEDLASRRGATKLESGQVEFKEANISNERVVKLSDGSIWEIKHNSGYGYGNESAFFISTGPKSANVWIDGSVYGATLLKGNPAYSIGMFATVIEEKGDGALLVLDDGKMIMIGSYDQFDTGWWMPPYPVLITGLNMWNLRKSKKVWIDEIID